MYQIGICDDEIHTCAELENMVCEIMRIRNQKCEIEHWYSGEGMCEHLKLKNRLDLIFLDVELVNMTGVEVGKFIRDILDDFKTQIIYISHNRSYAMQLFKMQPLDFLVKPFQIKEVEAALQTFLKIMEKKKLFLEYQIGNCYYKQSVEDIMYLQSDNKKIRMVLCGDKKEFYGNLKSIAAKLPSDFIQIHQSYVVNRDFVAIYSYEEVVMQSGEKIKISRPYRNIVRNILLRNREHGDQ